MYTRIIGVLIIKVVLSVMCLRCHRPLSGRVSVETYDVTRMDAFRCQHHLQRVALEVTTHLGQDRRILLHLWQDTLRSRHIGWKAGRIEDMERGDDEVDLSLCGRLQCLQIYDISNLA